MNWSWLKNLFNTIIAAIKKPAPPTQNTTSVVTPPVQQSAGDLSPTASIIHYNVWDASLIPIMMREQGFQNSNDNSLFYALFSTYGEHDWGNVGTNTEDIDLYNKSSAIQSWFSSVVADIGNKLNSNSLATSTLIVNDRNDAGGGFMVNPIRNQLLGMGVRPQQITDGTIFTL